MRDELDTRPTPLEELEPVQLDDQPECLAYIESKLAEDVRDLLIHFLKHNVEVFAWMQEDMGGIDPVVITPAGSFSLQVVATGMEGPYSPSLSYMP